VKELNSLHGLYPKNQIEIMGNINNPFAALTTEELKKLAED